MKKMAMKAIVRVSEEILILQILTENGDEGDGDEGNSEGDGGDSDTVDIDRGNGEEGDGDGGDGDSIHGEDDDDGDDTCIVSSACSRDSLPAPTSRPSKKSLTQGSHYVTHYVTQYAHLHTVHNTNTS